MRYRELRQRLEGLSRRRKGYRLAIVAVSGFLMVQSPSWGFRRTEHVALSAVAFRVARAQVGNGNSSGDPGACSLEVDQNLELDLASRFALLVAAADFHRDPYSLPHAPELDTGNATHTTDGIDPLELVDFERVEALLGSLWRYLSATHDNGGHFQESALRNHTFWHASALADAQAGQVGLALLAEAYALHFLEDFLAPGHVQVHRETTSDLAALGEHDRLNREGMNFRISKDMSPRLVAAVAAARKVIFSPSEREFVPEGTWDSALAYLEANDSIFLLGDGSLRRRPLEFAFIAAAASISVQEVLEAVPGCTPHTLAFQSYEWLSDFSGCFGADVQLSALQEPKAANGVGSWQLPPVGQPCPVHRHLWAWPVVVVTPTVEAFWRGDSEQVRGNVDLEVLATTIVLPEFVQEPGSRVPRPSPIGSPSVFYGLSFSLDETTTAIGPTIRFSYPVPRTDLEISLVLGSRYFSRPTREWNFLSGVRADWGMGLVGLTLGLFYDARDVPSRLEHDWVVRSGVTIGIPTSVFSR